MFNIFTYYFIYRILLDWVVHFRIWEKYLEMINICGWFQHNQNLIKNRKFLFYDHHIVVINVISWDHANVFHSKIDDTSNLRPSKINKNLLVFKHFSTFGSFQFMLYAHPNFIGIWVHFGISGTPVNHSYFPQTMKYLKMFFGSLEYEPTNISMW